MKQVAGTCRRMFSSKVLKERLEEIIPQKQALLKEIKKNYGHETLETVTLDQTLGGMRSINGLFHDISKLDAQSGITFRGYSIPECDKLLPKATEKGATQPLPEAMLWLLLTGEVPTDKQTRDFVSDLSVRGNLTEDCVKFIHSLPKDMHAMTMLSAALLYLQPQSKFAAAYTAGVHKSKYWEPTLEDTLDLCAKVPRLAAYIYRHKYFGDAIHANSSLDLAGNYAHMLGMDSMEFRECLRGYLTIHTDHEGGNVSAHTTKLVGSALADPYLAYSAGNNGLAGPLHGLANQEVLLFLTEMQKKVGNKPTDQQIIDHVHSVLKSGRVVPGYGHAVLRNTDPRFLHQREFARKYIKNDPLVDLVQQCYTVIPKLLGDLGKVKNPFPNVDAHSGVLLNHYGFSQYEYYTVVFSVSRAIGCTAGLVWDRALLMPIERPGSIDFDWIQKKYKK